LDLAVDKSDSIQLILGIFTCSLRSDGKLLVVSWLKAVISWLKDVISRLKGLISWLKRVWSVDWWRVSANWLMRSVTEGSARYHAALFTDKNFGYHLINSLAVPFSPSHYTSTKAVTDCSIILRIAAQLVDISTHSRVTYSRTMLSHSKNLLFVETNLKNKAGMLDFSFLCIF
jgi:hypothetical protein